MQLDTSKYFLLILYFISISTGVVIGLKNLNRLTTPYKLLTALLAYTLISELVSEGMLKQLANPVYKNFNYTLYSLVFISVICRFQYIRTKSRTFKTIIQLQYAGIVIYILFDSWQKGFLHFPSSQLIVLSFSLIILSLYRLAELAQNATEIAITKLPDFYVSSAYLIFFLLNITDWVYKAYCKNPPLHIANTFDWIFNIVCYIYYLLLAYSIYIDSKSPTASNIE